MKLTMKHHKITTLCACLVGMLSGFCTSAFADLVELQYSGTFSASSTLDGVSFDVDTPFTYFAVFDSSEDLSPLNGQGRFDTVVTFNITGFG